MPEEVCDKRECKSLHSRSFEGGRQSKSLGHDVLFQAWYAAWVILPLEVGSKSLEQVGGRKKSLGSIK